MKKPSDNSIKPTHTDVIIILSLLSTVLPNNSFIDRESIAKVYRRMLMKKLDGIRLLTLMKTKVTGKKHRTAVTIHKTN
jgi:hypothetical protein